MTDPLDDRSPWPHPAARTGCATFDPSQGRTVLLQDQSRALTDALASKPDAMRLAREAAAAAESERWAARANQCDDYASAFQAACEFIDAHVGDPDMTPKMRQTYAEFLRWRESVKVAPASVGAPRITINPITSQHRPDPDATVIVWHSAGWSRGFYAAQGGEWFDDEHNLLAGVAFWGEVE